MSTASSTRSHSLDLLVDCDPGIDDSVAFAYLAGEAMLGRVSLREVMAVRGNIGVAETGRNAAFVLDLLGLEAIVVSRGADEAVTPLPVQIDATHVHGPDGLGGQYDTSHPDRSTAVEATEVTGALRAAVMGGSTVLAVGPLTNIARALEMTPSLREEIPRIVAMGGAFGNPSGNVTDYAEYNVHVDAGAADEVLNSGIDVELVPLDATDHLLLGEQDLTGLSDTLAGRFIARLLRASIEIHHHRWGLPGCIVHDAVAAVLALHPQLGMWRQGSVTTVTDGENVGHTSFNEGPGSVNVAFDIDIEGVRATLLDALSRI